MISIKKFGVFLIFIGIISIFVGYYLNNQSNNFEYTFASVNDSYNSNKINFDFTNNNIKEVVIKYNDQEVKIYDKYIFNLDSKLDGTTYNFDIEVVFKNGEVKTFSEKYQLYNECDKNVNEEFNEVGKCSSDADKFSVKKVIKDNMTKNVCSEDIVEHSCSEKKRGCKINVKKGTLGSNGWYKSDVVLSLETLGENVSTYGLSNDEKEKPNSKSELSIKENSNEKKYYGIVEYEDGDVYKCSTSIKVDKSKPDIPSAVVKKNNANGEKLKNTNSFKNHRIWWGDFKSKDSESGVSHFEYSVNCSGNAAGKLVNYYTYPLNNGLTYNDTYCIRSVDKAGNNSKWSEPYYFKIDMVKPTCSVNVTSGTSKDTLKIIGNDNLSGVFGYSLNGSTYNTNNVSSINKGQKGTFYVKDKAGNVGSCINYKKALILLGDSRNYYLQKDVGGKRILTNYDSIYSLGNYNSTEIYVVGKYGATKDWLLGSNGVNSGAYQVDYLLNNLASNGLYYDVKIASNLGVNDINYLDVNESATFYKNMYYDLLNGRRSVVVNNSNVNTTWTKRKNVISVDFNFVSVNPIDENLLNNFDPSNLRTNALINQFNSIMSDSYGNKYINMNSQFGSWFNSTVKAGQKKFIVGNCNGINCEDGLHYSSYMNKTFIYPFYKNKLC